MDLVLADDRRVTKKKNNEKKIERSVCICIDLITNQTAQRFTLIFTTPMQVNYVCVK